MRIYSKKLRQQLEKIALEYKCDDDGDGVNTGLLPGDMSVHMLRVHPSFTPWFVDPSSTRLVPKM